MGFWVCNLNIFVHCEKKYHSSNFFDNPPEKTNFAHRRRTAQPSTVLNSTQNSKQE